MIISRNCSIFLIGAAGEILSLIYSTYSPASTSPLAFKVHPTTIEVGERTTLELRLPMIQELPLRPRIEDSLLTQSQSLILLHSEQKEESGHFVWKYDFTSYKVGQSFIPPLLVHYGANTYSSERTPIQSTSARAQEDNGLREDYPKMWLPVPWKVMAGSLLALLAGLWISRIIYQRLRRIEWKRWKKIIPEMEPLPRVDPGIWLREQLKQLRERVENGAEEDQLADELTMIIRRYLFMKYDIPFTNRTTLEFKQSLDYFALLMPLLEPFERLDRFKFSPLKKEKTGSLITEGILVVERTLCGT